MGINEKKNLEMIFHILMPCMAENNHFIHVDLMTFR